MVTALSLKHEFGDDVDIHVYDQSKSFNLSQGVELSPGPPFQIVMKALGHDVEAVMKEYACEHNTATVHDSAGNRMPFVEEIIESTRIYKAEVGKTPEGDVVECARFSINRGMFMSILQDEFFKAMGGKDAASKQLHWDHKLEEVVQEAEGKKTLRFANGAEVTWERMGCILQSEGPASMMSLRAMLVPTSSTASSPAPPISTTKAPSTLLWQPPFPW